LRRSPRYWPLRDQQALTADDASAGIDGFPRAAQHALGCADPPHRHDISDSLRTWIVTRAAGRLLQPASIYPEAGHNDDGTPRITGPQRAAEQLTVTHFRRDRRAPRALIAKPGSADALRPPPDVRHRPVARHPPLTRGVTYF